MHGIRSLSDLYDFNPTMFWFIAFTIVFLCRVGVVLNKVTRLLPPLSGCPRRE